MKIKKKVKSFNKNFAILIYIILLWFVIVLIENTSSALSSKKDKVFNRKEMKCQLKSLEKYLMSMSKDHEASKKIVKNLKRQLLESQLNSTSSKQQSIFQPLPYCSSRERPASPIPDHFINQSEMTYRRSFIINLTLQALAAYQQYALNGATLCPLAQSPVQHPALGELGAGSGETAIAALSTLWVMNQTDEFWRVMNNWIFLGNLQISNLSTDAFLAEKYVASLLGGLLSAFALSGTKSIDAMKKGDELARRLKWVYMEHDYPQALYNIKYPISHSYRSSLSQLGGQFLEQAYLSHLNYEPKELEPVERLRKRLLNEEGKGSQGLPEGLYSVKPGDRWFRDEQRVSLGSGGRDFYYTLLKSYLQSGRQLKGALMAYNAALEALFDKQEGGESMFSVTEDGYFWVRDLVLKEGEDEENKDDYFKENENLDHQPTLIPSDYMPSSACYLGAMFTLGASTFIGADRCNPLALKQQKLAVELTKTCQKAAEQTATGLPPRQIPLPSTDYSKKPLKKDYLLSPELAESYFILWRTTKERKYRDAAWNMALAIGQLGHTESGGTTAFGNVDDYQVKIDEQPAIFLSATLKYLYLTFTDDSVLPLDKWVFNAAGHPLPICGQHKYLPVKRCKYNVY